MTNYRSLVTFSILFLWSCSVLADAFLPGNYQVGHRLLEPVDAARNDRLVTTLLWYPVDSSVSDGEPIRYPLPWSEGEDGRWWSESPFIGGLLDAPVAESSAFPLFVLSHGNGGLPHGFELIGETLASYGYVVAAPQHAGNSYGTDAVPGMSSHRPADVQFVIDTLLERNATPGDTLLQAIDVEAIAVGGFSRGAATATAAVAGFQATLDDQFDVPPDARIQALVLLDGGPDTIDTFTREYQETVSVPTLALGGPVASFLTTSQTLPTVRPMHGFNLKNASHSEFSSFSTCKYRNHLIDSQAPPELLNAFGLEALVDCDIDLFPAASPMEIQARSVTAFLDHYLKDETLDTKLFEPNRDSLRGSVVINARVLGGGDEGVELRITDPSGRQIGIDPEDRTEFSDFESRQTRYLGRNSWRQIRLDTDDLLHGDYVLDFLDNSLISESSELFVTLELRDDVEHSARFSRRVILSTTFAPGEAIESITIQLVPEPTSVTLLMCTTLGVIHGLRRITAARKPT